MATGHSGAKGTQTPGHLIEGHSAAGALGGSIVICKKSNLYLGWAAIRLVVFSLETDSYGWKSIQTLIITAIKIKC